MDEPTDQELWDAALAGQSEAFGELFSRHHTAVYNFCFRRVSSWSQAEDLVSVVFLECWRSRRQMELIDQSVLPWLLGIALRVTRHQWRGDRRQRALLERLPPAPTLLGPNEDEIASRLDDERRMAAVLESITTLSADDQDVLALCVFAELDYQAAAEVLAVPIGTIRSRLSRARGRLRRLELASTPAPTVL